MANSTGTVVGYDRQNAPQVVLLTLEEPIANGFGALVSKLTLNSAGMSPKAGIL